ncbi:MAG: exodeoxyribonuclease VII small subunit [Bacteroidota bacterium]|nr:exodeoxyribonuclease VII small subunit [Bacteroidota bacterium]
MGLFDFLKKKELEEIVEEIEGGEIEIDAVSEKINRASELIEFCESKLKGIEFDLKTAVKKLNKK